MIFAYVLHFSRESRCRPIRLPVPTCLAAPMLAQECYGDGAVGTLEDDSPIAPAQVRVAPKPPHVPAALI